MKYALLDQNNVVVQTQPNAAPDFIECLDHVTCGMVYDGANFNQPTPVVELADVFDQINKALDVKLNAGILWAFNQGETQHPISLQPTMRETLSTFKQLLDAGQTNPHGGYLWSGGAELRKPDGGDLSDAAIDEICIFAGQWALAVSRIAIQEKKKCADGTYDIQAYDASAIIWTVAWDVILHPDWSDNIVLKNP